MKIAVSAQGTDMTSHVDPRFGRAKNIIVVDTETGAHEAHDNTLNLNAMQGAGIQTAKNVADLGVGAILSGNVGPKAFSALNTAGIEVYTGISGTVADAVAAYKNGTLTKADKANVGGHWM